MFVFFVYHFFNDYLSKFRYNLWLRGYFINSVGCISYIFYTDDYFNIISENKSKRKNVFRIYSNYDFDSCNFYILFNDMGKQLFLSTGLSIISTLFQYIILNIYGKLTNPSYLKIFFENNFGIKYGYASSQSSSVFAVNTILFIIATLLYMKIEKDINTKLYWLIAFVPILFFVYVAVFSVIRTPIYKMESMVLILIPIGYFISFYYNYRMIIRS